MATAINKYGANLNDSFWVLFFVLIPDIDLFIINKKYNTILLPVKPNPQKKPAKLYSDALVYQKCNFSYIFSLIPNLMCSF